MRNAIVGLAIVALVGAGWLVESGGQADGRQVAQKKEPAPKRDKQKVKELMALKLEHHQKLLAALVMNDLAGAAKHAENLQKVRKDAAWVFVKTEQYDTWSREFDAAAGKVIKAAADKNPDAAKLGYLEMTMTCFHCHAYVRDLGDIRLDTFDR
jgi:hypothetical protein